MFYSQQAGFILEGGNTMIPGQEQEYGAGGFKVLLSSFS